ncbi:hypothetical protein OZD66_05460, partial [Wolbachia endosymbiont of Drosophila baimaii]|nr:hypothetical protein [Wolbachia endosymbiont of Drosophila baimaii]
MNKNIKLYSSEEVESNNTLQLSKPKFDKPSFEKPVIKKIVSGKTKEEFDITKDMTQEEIDKMPQIIAFLIIVRTGHRKAESTARRKDSNRGM